MIIYDIEIENAILGRNETKKDGIKYCAGFQDFDGMVLVLIVVVLCYNFLVVKGLNTLTTRGKSHPKVAAFLCPTVYRRAAVSIQNPQGKGYRLSCGSVQRPTTIEQTTRRQKRMDKITFQVDLEVLHGLSNVSEAKALELKAHQLLFYAHSLFWAISNLSTFSNPDYRNRDFEEGVFFQEIENLANLGELLTENLYGSVDRLRGLAEENQS